MPRLLHVHVYHLAFTSLKLTVMKVPDCHLQHREGPAGTGMPVSPVLMDSLHPSSNDRLLLIGGG